MAGFTKRDQVIWCIPAGLAAFYVMHIKNFVFGFALTALAGVSVPEENILSDVPEVKLFPLLVFRAGNPRVFDLLDVKRCCLYGDTCYRKDPAHLIRYSQMRIHFLLYGRGEPSFVPSPVVEPWCTVTRFPVTSGSAVLTSCGNQIHYEYRTTELQTRLYIRRCYDQNNVVPEALRLVNMDLRQLTLPQAPTSISGGLLTSLLHFYQLFMS